MLPRISPLDSSGRVRCSSAPGQSTESLGIPARVFSPRERGMCMAPQIRGRGHWPSTSYRPHRFLHPRGQAGESMGTGCHQASLPLEQCAFSSRHAACVPASSWCRPLTGSTPLHLCASHLPRPPYTVFSSRTGIMPYLGFAECWFCGECRRNEERKMLICCWLSFYLLDFQEITTLDFQYDQPITWKLGGNTVLFHFHSDRQPNLC